MTKAENLDIILMREEMTKNTRFISFEKCLFL